jgi:hypothetical protein
MEHDNQHKKHLALCCYSVRVQLTVILSVFMLSVNYAECHKPAHYDEFRYAECRYAECRGAAKMYSLNHKINDLWI